MKITRLEYYPRINPQTMHVGPQLLLARIFFLLAQYTQIMHILDQWQCAISSAREIVQTPHATAKPTHQTALRAAAWRFGHTAAVLWTNAVVPRVTWSDAVALPSTYRCLFFESRPEAKCHETARLQFAPKMFQGENYNSFFHACSDDRIEWIAPWTRERAEGPPIKTGWLAVEISDQARNLPRDLQVQSALSRNKCPTTQIFRIAKTIR